MHPDKKTKKEQFLEIVSSLPEKEQAILFKKLVTLIYRDRRESRKSLKS